MILANVKSVTTKMYTRVPGSSKVKTEEEERAVKPLSPECWVSETFGVTSQAGCSTFLPGAKVLEAQP